MKFASSGLDGFDIPSALVKYGKLYITDFNEYSVVFRQLTYTEHKKFVYASTNASTISMLHYISQRLCSDAILWFSGEEEEIELIPAGIVNSLSELILKLSGPQNMEEMLDLIDNIKNTGIIIHENADSIIGNNTCETWRDVLVRAIEEEQKIGKTYRELYENAKKQNKLAEAAEKSKMNG